jgi:hypothetical protein
VQVGGLQREGARLAEERRAAQQAAAPLRQVRIRALTLYTARHSY